MQKYISVIQENLAKTGCRWVINIHEHKRYYYTFDNSLLFAEHSEHYTNLSRKSRNVRFLPCQHRGVGTNAIRVRAKPCMHRFHYSGHSAEKFPVGAIGHS